MQAKKKIHNSFLRYKATIRKNVIIPFSYYRIKDYIFFNIKYLEISKMKYNMYIWVRNFEAIVQICQ